MGSAIETNYGADMKNAGLVSQGMDETGFPENRSTLDFIYTSILSGFDLDEAQKILRRLKTYRRVTSEEGIYQEGIEPFLNVSEKYLRFSYPQAKTSIRLSGEILKKGGKRKFITNRYVCVCPSGKVSYRVSLACRERLTFEQLLQMVRGDRDDLALSWESSHHPRSSTLFKLFEADVGRLLGDLSANGLTCEWLDLGCAYDRTGRSSQSRPDRLVVQREHWQLPYIFVCVGLHQFRGKDIESAVWNHRYGFGSILRAKQGSVSQRFIGDHLVPEANMMSDSRGFLALYPRSCLFVHGGQRQHPGKKTIPGIVDTLGFLRMTWHGLIAANLLLDRSVRDLRSQFGDFEAKVLRRGRGTANRIRTGGNADRKLTMILADIARLRINIAEMLEDPTAYRRAAGHIGELYDAGSREFRLEEMQRAVLEKLRQVGKLHDNITELWQRHELDVLDKEWHKLGSNENRKLYG